MRNKKFVLILACLLAAMFLTETVCVSAASMKEIRQNIQQKEKQAEENKAKLKEGKEKEKNLSARVLELEEQVNEKQNSIDELVAAIAEGEKKLKKLEKKLKKAEEKVSAQNQNLSARLRNMYKSGSVGFVDVLLDSSSFSEFLTNLDMVERIYSGDQEVLQGLQDAYDEIDQRKKEVQALQTELKTSKEVAEKEKAALTADKAEIEKQKKEIAASNEETEAMMDALNAEADALTAELKKREAEEKKRREEEKKKQEQANQSSGNSSSSSSSGSSSSGTTPAKGKFIWPTPSSHYITSYFGYRYHPISGRYKYHAGMDIGASYGSNVVATQSGTVIRSSWYGGYGYCVMIDHGNGLVSLYGHNSSLKVSSGQHVSQGQVIAKVGSTGYSTGPHCHFEVRKNGNPTDPMKYM